MDLFGIKKLKHRIEDVEDQLNILECEHSYTELYTRWQTVYVEKCVTCGKVLKYFSALDFYKEKLKRSEGDSEELRQKIKDIENEKVKE